jgi:hypothetical protein
MTRQLIATVKRNQRPDGNEAPVARGKARPGPDVTEEHIVRELGQFGGNVANRLLRCGFLSQLISSYSHVIAACGRTVTCRPVSPPADPIDTLLRSPGQ